jgi:hypothetical protein
MVNSITSGDNFQGTIAVNGNTTRVIASGTKYRVLDDPDGIYRSLTYDGTTYEIGDIFTGTSVTSYEGDAEFAPVINITSWEFYITIKRLMTDSDANALLKYHLTSLSAPTDGKADFDIPASTWHDFSSGEAWMELKWKDANGDIFTFETATALTINPSLLDAI